MDEAKGNSANIPSHPSASSSSATSSATGAAAKRSPPSRRSASVYVIRPPNSSSGNTDGNNSSWAIFGSRNDATTYYDFNAPALSSFREFENLELALEYAQGIPKTDNVTNQHKDKKRKCGQKPAKSFSAADCPFWIDMHLNPRDQIVTRIGDLVALLQELHGTGSHPTKETVKNWDTEERLKFVKDFELFAANRHYDIRCELARVADVDVPKKDLLEKAKREIEARYAVDANNTSVVLTQRMLWSNVKYAELRGCFAKEINGLHGAVTEDRFEDYNETFQREESGWEQAVTDAETNDALKMKEFNRLTKNNFPSIPPFSFGAGPEDVLAVVRKFNLFVFQVMDTKSVSKGNWKTMCVGCYNGEEALKAGEWMVQGKCNCKMHLGCLGQKLISGSPAHMYDCNRCLIEKKKIKFLEPVEEEVERKKSGLPT